MLPDLYTLHDLADRYDLSYDRLGDLVRSGELVGFKIGRAWVVRGEDWTDFLARRAAKAAS